MMVRGAMVRRGRRTLLLLLRRRRMKMMMSRRGFADGRRRWRRGRRRRRRWRIVVLHFRFGEHATGVQLLEILLAELAARVRLRGRAVSRPQRMREKRRLVGQTGGGDGVVDARTPRDALARGNRPGGLFLVGDAGKRRRRRQRRRGERRRSQRHLARHLETAPLVLLHPTARRQRLTTSRRRRRLRFVSRRRRRRKRRRTRRRRRERRRIGLE